MIAVASYCRVSTDQADQANSFESQQRYFRDYIARCPDWTLYRVYADEGITGTSTQKRTEFNRMLADARAGKFRLILTKEISRFSRNILDTIRYTRELKELGIGVLFLTENLNSLDPEAEMLLTFMGTIAQEESRRTSVRVKWGQTRRMEQGVVFGRSLLGYTVRNGAITPEPEGAALVRLIFRKYGVEKKSTGAIARELQATGFKPAGGSTAWRPGQIIRILKNEKYVGDLIQKKTVTPNFLTHEKRPNRGQEPLVILRDHHTPIVDRALWDAVQAELGKRRKKGGESAPASRQHPFSGKIRCGECGANFVARYRYPAGEARQLRWSCAGASCGCRVGKLLRDDDAREMVKAALQALRLDVDGLLSRLDALIRRAGEGEPGETGRLRREREALERKRQKLLEAYLSGDVERIDYRRFLEEFTERLAYLDAQLAAEHVQQAYGDNRALPKAILEGQRESEAFYKCVLERITVYQDRHMELRLVGNPQIFHFSDKSS